MLNQAEMVEKPISDLGKKTLKFKEIQSVI